MIFDTVIVGGGISGLTSALILSRHGRRVAIVEESRRPAPLVAGFQRGEVYFESAFHYAGGLGDGEILDLLFRYLGIDRFAKKIPLGSDGFDIFRDSENGREFHFPCGLSALRESLCEVYPQEMRGINAYLRTLETAFQRLPYLNPQVTDIDWRLAGTVGGPSLHQVLQGFINDPQLYTLLTLHTLLHGASPHEIPFFIHAGVALPFYRSAHRIAGGGRSLATAFAARLESSGIPLFLGRGARKILLSTAGRLEGVELADGEPLACRECVVSIHPRRFLDLAPQGALRPAYRKRILGLEETSSGYILFLHGRKPPDTLATSNLFLGVAGSSHCDKTTPLDRRPLFVAGGAPVPGSPSGHHGWSVICPAPWRETATLMGVEGQRNESYRAAKDEAGHRIFRRLAREAPEIVRGSRIVEMATPLTLRDYCGGPQGGLYGVKHAIGQYNPQATTRIPNVFLCGQATAAPGVLGAMVSAFLTCGQILGHDRLRRDIMEKT